MIRRHILVKDSDGNYVSDRWIELHFNGMKLHVCADQYTGRLRIQESSGSRLIILPEVSNVIQLSKTRI